ncbi:hypothetical protein AB0G04_42285 [Actinoplanes sp. NPDC023801]|uniref:hypothetical protein n=1 Tax=Actinoplanes sp. NPDC023801 TaxID=3154595 RepID=UPI0034096583
MPEFLSTTDFDLPVTEDFLNRVHRGVRRRRALRLTVAGCAVLTVTGGVFAVTRPHEVTLPVPAASFGTASTAIADVDRFRIGHLPEGITLDPRADSATLIISPDGEDVTDGRSAGPLDATVAKSMRRFEQTNGGSYLWITVLRPLPATPERGTAILLNTLANRFLNGTTTVATFDVPTGKARLTRTSGTEDAGHGLVIISPDLSVIAIEANARVPADVLKAVAAGITPA